MNRKTLKIIAYCGVFVCFPGALAGCSSSTSDNDVSVTDSGSDSVLDSVTDLTELPGDDPGGVDSIASDMGVDSADGNDIPKVCAMKIGVGKRDITPTVEPYEDLNGNIWRNDDEPYTDLNNNDKFDPVYVAGYGSREALGVHDSIWSRCMAIESAGDVYVFCASDVIGLGLKHYDTLLARLKELRPELNIGDKNVTWASTHTHQGPDTQGVWDIMPPEYLAFIDEQTAQAAVEAIDSMQPGGIRVVSATQTPELVRDIDVPEVFDNMITVLQGVAENGDVVGTVVSVANHPESAGPDNTLVSSDFPHYLRERVELAVGGMAIYFSGALGLMQTPVRDFDNTDMAFTEFIGNAYGDLIVAALENPPEPTCEFIYSSEIRQQMVLENFDFYAGILANMIDGFSDYLYNEPGACEMMGCVDVPVSAIKFGNLLTWINVAGEMTPELVTGTYPDPLPVPGEFADAEREPYLQQFVTTQYRFVAGLSDTEIGYIYPLYQCDRANHEHQRNSAGQNVAGSLMQGYSKVFEEIAATEAAFNK